MADKNRTALGDWDNIRFFLALARAQTLSGAARALRVNHATVARRTAALEAELGCSLFVRREDGYALTLQGQAIFVTAEAMERSALAITPLDSLGAGLQGKVRITTVPSIAQGLLLSCLAKFVEHRPELTLEFQLETRVASLARRESDIALRLGHPKDSSLWGKKLANVSYAFYGTRRQAESFAEGDVPRLIGFDEDDVDVAENIWLRKTFPQMKSGLRVSGVIAQAAAARAGYGFALLPRFIGDADEALDEVKHLASMPPRELWVLSPKDLIRVPRIRAVFDAIVEAIGQNRVLIEGHDFSQMPTSRS